MPSVAIFGVGSAMRDFLAVLPEDVSIAGLGDNNSSLHGQTILGNTIIHSPAEFAALQADLYVITARAVDVIRAQLLSLGIPDERLAAHYPSYSEKIQNAVGADIRRMNDVLGLNLPMPGITTMYLWPTDRGSATHCVCGGGAEILCATIL